jgi:hypothetical protein
MTSTRGRFTLSLLRLAYSLTSSDPPQHLHSYSLPLGRLSNSMTVRLRSTILLSLGSQAIDVTGHANFSSYDRIAPMARCIIPDMFELIATGSSPLSGVHNNFALSSL